MGNIIYKFLKSKKTLYIALFILLFECINLFFIFATTFVGWNRLSYNCRNINIETTITELQASGSKIEIEYSDSTTSVISRINGIYTYKNMELFYFYETHTNKLYLCNLRNISSNKEVEGWLDAGFIHSYMFMGLFWNMPMEHLSVTPTELIMIQYKAFADVVSHFSNLLGYTVDAIICSYFYIYLYYLKYVFNTTLIFLLLRFIFLLLVKWLKCWNNRYQSTQGVKKATISIYFANFLKNCSSPSSIIAYLAILYTFSVPACNNGECLYRGYIENDFGNDMPSMLLSMGVSPDTTFVKDSIYKTLYISDERKTISGWYNTSDFKVNFNIYIENEYAYITLTRYFDKRSEKESDNWFLPAEHSYKISPFRLIYLQFIINKELISKFDIKYSTLTNSCEFICGYIAYIIYYYYRIIIPVWLLLLISSIIYKYRMRKKYYENFKKQFPPTPPLPPTNN